MKKGRHTKILELIQAKEICTQDELLSELKDCGFNVTQATVSRDIKELKLTKTLSKNGKNCYTSKSFDLSERAAGMSALFSTSVISVEYAGNLVIVKTRDGGYKGIACNLTLETKEKELAGLETPFNRLDVSMVNGAPQK